MRTAYNEFHLLDHLCGDFQKFRCKQVLDAAPYENFVVVLKRTCRRTFIRSATKTRETTSAMEPILDGQKMKGRDEARTGQWLVKARRMQRLKAVECFLPMDLLQIDLDKLLRKNMSCSLRYVKSKTAEVEQLRQHLSTDGFYKFVDVIRGPAKIHVIDWRWRHSANVCETCLDMCIRCSHITRLRLERAKSDT